MIQAFLQDMSTPLLPLPPALPAGCVRLVTWNVNILCGPDWNTPVSAMDAAKLLLSFQADVLVLQELPNEALDTLWSEALKPALARVRELDTLLSAQGYTLLRSLGCENSTLLAVSSRLQVEETEGFTLDAEPTVSVNDSEVWSESRGARYALVQLPVGAGAAKPSRLAIYATHLSHKDSSLVRPPPSLQPPQTAPEAEVAHDRPSIGIPSGEWAGAQSVGGVRLRQARRLVDHWQARASRPADGAIVLADFNAPLRRHYTEEEWRVVAAGLSSPAVAQPLDDGVSTLLSKAGFRCAYELAPDNNFGGRPAPPMTHWTGTTVDFAYVTGEASRRMRGAYVVHTSLSDHLPVVFDLC